MAPRLPSGSASARPTLALRRATMPRLSSPRREPLRSGRPDLPLWRGVISPSSFSQCGRLGVPILTARLPVARIKERWAAYEAGLDAGGHDAAAKARLLAQSALWRNVYVAETNAQAEDELSALLLQARGH